MCILLNYWANWAAYNEIYVGVSSPPPSTINELFYIISEKKLYSQFFVDRNMKLEMEKIFT